MNASTEPRDRCLPLSNAIFHILLALYDGDKHGYAIMTEAQEISNGVVRLGPGTLYGNISKLIDKRFIEESPARPEAADDDPRRRYYRLTNLGKAVTEKEAQRLHALVQAARNKSIPYQAKLA